MCSLIAHFIFGMKRRAKRERTERVGGRVIAKEKDGKKRTVTEN